MAPVAQMNGFMKRRRSTRGIESRPLPPFPVSVHRMHGCKDALHPYPQHSPPRSPPRLPPALSAALLLCLGLALLPCSRASLVPSSIWGPWGPWGHWGHWGHEAARTPTLPTANSSPEIAHSVGVTPLNGVNGISRVNGVNSSLRTANTQPAPAASADRSPVRTLQSQFTRLTSSAPVLGGTEEAEQGSRFQPYTQQQRRRRRVLRRTRVRKAGNQGPAAAAGASAGGGAAGGAAAAAASRRLWGDATPLPGPPRFNTPRKSVAGKGPCNPKKAVRIAVNSFSDILKRVKFAPTKTVVLVFQRNIVLKRPLVFARNFSCTILMAKAGTRATLSTTWSDAPAITMVNTSNILMNNVNLKFGISPSSKECRAPIYDIGVYKEGLTCPGLYIIRSYGIQVTKASIYGRIEIFRSIFVRLDNIKATMPENAYNKRKPYKSFDTKGVIRMGLISTGTNFISSNNVISNSQVFGHWNLITLHMGAVGVTIKNNYLHNFLFSGIICGDFLSWVFDCHHTYIGYNYIANPPAWIGKDGQGEIVDPDNAGIYFHTRWFNPGNLVTCNYVLNQISCIYLDGISTGVTVVGGVCWNIDNTGVKVNNGKFNKVSSLLVIKSRLFASFITCEYAASRHPTYKYPANERTRNWEGMRRAYYNTPAINKAYPFMKSICNPVPSSINGHNCNPSGGWPASMTGKCSAIAYSNYVETFYYGIDYRSWLNVTDCRQGCETIPGVFAINKQVPVNITKPRFVAGFRNPKKGDFGLKRNSPIYKLKPRFKSCPLALTRRRPVPLRTYLSDFNIAKPYFFNAVVNLPIKRMIDPSVKVPL